MPIIMTSTKWPTWIVVVGGKFADIYYLRTPMADLEHVRQIANPDARLKEQDLVTDQPGRTFDISGKGRHRIEPKSSRKRQAESRFASEIAEQISRASDAREFSTFSIVAPPRILGELRAAIKAPLRAHIACEIPKDLTSASCDEIKKHIENELALPAA